MVDYIVVLCVPISELPQLLYPVTLPPKDFYLVTQVPVYPVKAIHFYPVKCRCVYPVTVILPGKTCFYPVESTFTR